MGRRLFCDINPTCYAIATKKEIIVRHLKNFFSREKFAKTRQEPLPIVVAEYHCNLIKRAQGVDLTLQENKAVNIRLACKKLNGIVVRPGETFSFCITVGKCTKKKGYKEGRILIGNKLRPGMGGGLCNLGNLIHRMVLHTPMSVTEFHSHSDALAPDEGERVVFSAGTSVYYNYLDYRFKNNTDQPLQLLVWCDEDKLYGQLRCEREFAHRYELVEEDHHFRKEGDKYYRFSKIYRILTDKQSGEITKELVRKNRSEVMYDYALIPKEQIREFAVK